MTDMVTPGGLNDATEADIELADSISWSMMLEGRKLTEDGYNRLLAKIVADHQLPK
jgi:hypothetical protein